MVDFVDIHSHTLPGVDDGSPSFEVSLAMLEVALGQGVGTMVLTPHLRPIDGPDQKQEHRVRPIDGPDRARSGEAAAVVVGRGAGAGFADVRRGVPAAKVFAQQKGKNWFFPTPVGAWNEPLKDR